MDPLKTFDEHRNLLFSIAYRMLGSAADAEDMIQETFIRWQEVKHEEIVSARAMLVTIISRLCINELQSARVQREQYVGEWLPEPLLSSETADPSRAMEVDESLSMAFLVLLERLNPVERAALLLHDVFDYEYSEIAQILNRNEENCRQILRRARQRIDEDRPRFSAPSEEGEALMQKFLAATTSGDIDGFLSVLAQDVVLYTDGGGRGPATMNPIFGSKNVASLLVGAARKFAPPNTIRLVTQINGQHGIVAYHDGHAHGVLAAQITDGRIHRLFIITNPDKLRRIPVLPAVN